MRNLVAMLVVLAFVVLVLDLRRLRALVRSKGGARRDVRAGIPAGTHPDQVGLPLRQIQMRIPLDRQDDGASAA